MIYIVKLIYQTRKGIGNEWISDALSGLILNYRDVFKDFFTISLILIVALSGVIMMIFVVPFFFACMIPFLLTIAIFLFLHL